MIMYPNLFSPLQIGNTTIENRIAMAPMAILGMWNLDGSLSQRAIDYYLERARGGTGLIITTAFKVENRIDSLIPGIPIISPALIASLTELVEGIHALGTRIFVQLTAGFGRVSHPIMLVGQPVSASAIPNFWNPEIICKELGIDEISTIVGAFGDAADILALTGIDGIELHGHEGYLFDQFTTSLWNKRTDQYGGSLENRLRFPIEVLQQIKSRLGADFPVEYRFGLKHYAKGINKSALPGEQFKEAGRDTPEGVAMAQALEKAGFDALHVDAGSYDSWYWAHPPNFFEHGCLIDLVAQVKPAVRIPVIAAGRLDSPAIAEKAISEGKMDIAAIGRGLLADPHWAVKTKQGRELDIRPCIACHEGCLNRIFQGKPLSCSLNPATGRERLYALTRAQMPGNVIIVGGGVGGLEAARALSLRGHQVRLFEQRSELGGHVIEGCVPEFKKDLRALLNWYNRQLDTLGVDVVLGMQVTEAILLEEKADAIILATGSTYVPLAIPGSIDNNLMTMSALFRQGKPQGDVFTIVGGGLVGCEAALWLARQGKTVHLIERLPELMAGGLPVPFVNRQMLLDLLDFHEVTIWANHTASQYDSGKLEILNLQNQSSHRIETDRIAYAVGMKPNNQLYDTLRNHISNLYLIGDARKPRNIQGAIWDAYEIARFI
jgi:2-enoate reductase